MLAQPPGAERQARRPLHQLDEGAAVAPDFELGEVRAVGEADARTQAASSPAGDP